MDEQDTETAQAQTTEEVTEQVTEAAAETEEPKFNKAQLQQLASMTGRLITNQLEEKVMPLFANKPKDQTPDELASKREKWLEKIFEGRIDEVVDEVDSIRDKKKQTLTQQVSVATKKAITEFNADPLYKDVYADTEKLAAQYLAKGYPPAAAAEVAFAKAKANHLENRASVNEDLGMASSGKKIPSSKKAKVPSHFKKSMERDIASGLYENEDDWVNNGLSDQIRAKYGL